MAASKQTSKHTHARAQCSPASMGLTHQLSDVKCSKLLPGGCVNAVDTFRFQHFEMDICYFGNTVKTQNSKL